MRSFRRLATCIGFAALTATSLVVVGSQAKQKSWGQECKETVDKKKDRLDCCWLKAAKCSAKCNDDYFGKWEKYHECHDDCNEDEARCKKEVQGAVAGGVSTPTRLQTKKSSDTRVCCKTGIRHAWAQARDCESRKGQVVDGRFCSAPPLQTRTRSPSSSSPERICCNADGAVSMATPSECRARHGEPVHLKMCQGRNLGVTPLGDRVLKAAPRE
jgi:hypothetical protein